MGMPGANVGTTPIVQLLSFEVPEIGAALILIGEGGIEFIDPAMDMAGVAMSVHTTA